MALSGALGRANWVWLGSGPYTSAHPAAHCGGGCTDTKTSSEVKPTASPDIKCMTMCSTARLPLHWCTLVGHQVGGIARCKVADTTERSCHGTHVL